MTAASTNHAGRGGTTTYEIRVQGHLDDHWSGWLGGLTISRREDGTSTLTGPVADQAQLHGILAGLRDMGVSLLELRRKASSENPANAAVDREAGDDRSDLSGWPRSAASRATRSRQG